MCNTCTLENCKKVMLVDFQAEKIIYLSWKKLHYLLRNHNFLRTSDFQLPFLFEDNRFTWIFLILCKVFYSLSSLHKKFLKNYNFDVNNAIFPNSNIWFSLLESQLTWLFLQFSKVQVLHICRTIALYSDLSGFSKYQVSKMGQNNIFWEFWVKIFPEARLLTLFNSS